MNSIFTRYPMFRTYKHAEFQLQNLFGSEFQMWHYVELGIHLPWFYVGTREGEGDDVLVTMKMLPNLDVLECYLKEHSQSEIESLQLVSPSHINGTSGWIMETLLGVSILGDANGRRSGYRCTVKGGHTYDVMDMRAGAVASHVTKVVFSLEAAHSETAPC